MSETSDEAPKQSLSGYFDRVLNGFITGWAYDSNQPDDGVPIEMLIDDLQIFTGDADIYRPDLKKAGFGNGRHAFNISVPKQYFDSAPHCLELRIGGSGIKIHNTPKAIVFGDRDVFENAAAKVNASQRSTPAISLILPTYNRGELMEKTVRTYARCQGWDKVELIIVDDGSRDDTPGRIAKLRGEFQNILTERINNSGAGRARNIAASMASAPLLLLIGDDVAPVNSNFLETHLAAHEKFPDRSVAILGKITWPSSDDGQVNYVMQHIQGDGQQQFGYKFMEPYKWYDWHLFYSSNVSIKRNLVSDWRTEGYDEGFSQYGYEDTEFAYRVTQQYKARGRNFQLLYVPAAVLSHVHPYSVSSFIRRQISAGAMARRFFEKHPEVAPDIGIHQINEKLSEPVTNYQLPIEHYLTVFEGLKSWALIIEAHHGLGSQNWHGDFLRAIFQLAYAEGYLRTILRADANLASAARSILDRVVADLNQALFREAMGSIPQLRLA